VIFNWRRERRGTLLSSGGGVRYEVCRLLAVTHGLAASPVCDCASRVTASLAVFVLAGVAVEALGLTFVIRSHLILREDKR